jgi:hypothetical protein
LSDIWEKSFDVLAVLGCAWMIVDGLRTGKARVPVPFNEIDYSRAENPLAFWLTILALALAVIVAASLLAGILG